MEKQSVKQLKALAREKGIKGYYRMRKAELIEALEEESEIFYSANDQFIPEVDIPIPAPSRVTQMRNLASDSLTLAAEANFDTAEYPFQ